MYLLRVQISGSTLHIQTVDFEGRILFTGILRKAEVCHLRNHSAREENVGRFHVSVYNTWITACVQVFES